MELDYKAIGKRIKIARIKKNLTQVQFTASSGRHSVLERPFSETNGRPFFS